VDAVGAAGERRTLCPTAAPFFSTFTISQIRWLVVTKDEKNTRLDQVRGYPHKLAMIETLKKTTRIDKLGWRTNQNRLL
jgi:hypothetical protein